MRWMHQYGTLQMETSSMIIWNCSHQWPDPASTLAGKSKPTDQPQRKRLAQFNEVRRHLTMQAVECHDAEAELNTISYILFFMKHSLPILVHWYGVVNGSSLQIYILL